LSLFSRAAREVAMIAEVRRLRMPTRAALDDYWRQSRRPLTNLVFVLPLLVLYEGGVLLLGPAAVRNGADVWLRQLLDALGFGQYFLLPALTVGALLAWHHTTREPWQVRPRVLRGMWLESLALGFALLVLARLQGALLMQLGGEPPPAALERGALDALGRLVLFFGAGIYEEVLFRLLLLPAVAALLALWVKTPKLNVVGAVVVTSLVFSLAHYVGAHGESFRWHTFLFRFSAGGFFAVLFVQRGFGIAAGTHALYDIFVGVL
jgi:membrane protease YdiL (CAAX protease family)